MNQLKKFCPHCAKGEVTLSTEYYGVGGVVLILIGLLGFGNVLGVIIAILGLFLFGKKQFEVCSRFLMCGYKKQIS